MLKVLELMATPRILSPSELNQSRKAEEALVYLFSLDKAELQRRKLIEEVRIEQDKSDRSGK